MLKVSVQSVINPDAYAAVSNDLAFPIFDAVEGDLKKGEMVPGKELSGDRVCIREKK
jgi:hypothetical protein